MQTTENREHATSHQMKLTSKKLEWKVMKKQCSPSAGVGWARLWKGVVGGVGNFTIVSHMIKVNSNRDEPCSCTSDVTWWKWHFSSTVLLPKTYYPSLIMKNHQVNPYWGAFYQIPDQCSSKLQGHHKQAKSKKLSQPRAAQGHMTAKCDMESWLRRALRKN